MMLPASAVSLLPLPLLSLAAAALLSVPVAMLCCKAARRNRKKAAQRRAALITGQPDTSITAEPPADARGSRSKSDDAPTKVAMDGATTKSAEKSRTQRTQTRSHSTPSKESGDVSAGRNKGIRQKRSKEKKDQPPAAMQTTQGSKDRKGSTESAEKKAAVAETKAGKKSPSTFSESASLIRPVAKRTDSPTQGNRTNTSTMQLTQGTALVTERSAMADDVTPDAIDSLHTTTVGACTVTGASTLPSSQTTQLVSAGVDRPPRSVMDRTEEEPAPPTLKLDEKSAVLTRRQTGGADGKPAGSAKYDID